MDLIFNLLGGFVLIVLFHYIFSSFVSLSQKTQNEYNRILDAVPIPAVIIWKLDLSIYIINKSASELLEYSNNDFRLKKYFDIYLNSEKGAPLFQILQEHGTISDYEILMYSGSGREITILLSANSIIIENKPALFLGLIDITHQKRLEKSVKENKELYKSIIKTSPDPIIMSDMLGKIFMLSPSAFELFGFSMQNNYPYGGYCLDYIHPEDLPRAKNALRELKAGIKSENNEYRAYSYDGALIEIESHAEIVKDQDGNPERILFIIRDITRRKEMERLILEKEERFNIIFQEVPDPLIIVQDSGTIIDINRTLEEWFSINKADYLLRNIQDAAILKSREYPEGIFARIHNLNQGEKIEIPLLLPDNTERYTVISIKRLLISNSNAILIHINDIDEIKRAYHTLTLTNNKINLLNSITRHDILNKVMVITGYSEILQKEIEDSDSLNIISAISDSGNDISHLINFTKEYQDLGLVKPKWHSIHNIVNKPVMLSLLSGIILTKPDKDIEIYADPMLEKVLYNLIENSKRHGTFVTHISLTYVQDGMDYLLVYTDDGQGIYYEDKERIFKKGFGKNSGLGLFIIKEILSITGLSIRECGIPNEGVRFEITLPVGKYRIKEGVLLK